MRSKQPPETGTYTVTGQTLKEALHNARQQYGERACIVETRTVAKRESGDLGQSRLIEVTVALPTATPAKPAAPKAAEVAPVRDRRDVSDAIVAEIERIEGLVESLKAESEDAAATTGRDDRPGAGFDDYLLGKALLTAGASLPAVRHLRRLTLAETGDTGLKPAQAHLQSLIRTSGGRWDTLAGCHLFLGGPGSGKTDLVLSAAARLKEQGRRILVLAYAPRHQGEVSRLQTEASERGYDAAILRDAAQLAGGLEYFEQYDAVLIDTPSLDTPAMADEELHDLLAGQEEIHRHMLVPMDCGLTEREDIWTAARTWNCDWFAVTRLDRTNRPGKLIDVMLAAPMPLSVVGGGAWPGGAPEIATPEGLLKKILKTEDTVRAVETTSMAMA